MGTRCLLLTTSAVPETLVYQLIKSVFDHFKDFRLMHPVLAELTPADLVPRGLGRRCTRERSAISAKPDY